MVVFQLLFGFQRVWMSKIYLQESGFLNWIAEWKRESQKNIDAISCPDFNILSVFCPSKVFSNFVLISQCSIFVVNNMWLCYFTRAIEDTFEHGEGIALHPSSLTDFFQWIVCEFLFCKVFFQKKIIYVGAYTNLLGDWRKKERKRK